MKKDKCIKVNGTLKVLKRLNSSVNGNPRFLVMIDDVVITTKSDYSYCYNIENLKNKGCICEAFYYETKAGNAMLEDISEIK
jgi:hypothetical protein